MLESEIERVDRSQAADPLAEKLGLIDTAPALHAPRLKARAEGRLANIRADASTEREDLLDAGVAEMKARNLERYGANSVLAWMNNLDIYLASGIYDAFQAEMSFLLKQRSNFDVQFSPEIDAAFDRTPSESAAIRMAEAAERMSNTAEQIGASAGSRAQE